MPVHTFTGYQLTGIGVPIGASFEVTFTDNDFTADWYDEDPEFNEVAEIDGTSYAVDGTGIYRITFVTAGGDTVTEDIVMSEILGLGHVFFPTEDSQFGTGSNITVHLDWQQEGIQYDQITCFTSGTLIQTPNGPIAVETLKPNDLILTLDHGPQPVLWAGSSRVDMVRQILRPKVRPIVFQVGALGHDAQCMELSVSPPHRMLLTGGHLELFFGVDQAFAPARALVGLKGIHRAPPQPNLTYHHLLLPQHEVIFANNIPSESFFPGGEALRALDAQARRSLFRAFPKLVADPAEYGHTARMCLTKREARSLHPSRNHGFNVSLRYPSDIEPIRHCGPNSGCLPMNVG